MDGRTFAPVSDPTLPPQSTRPLGRQRSVLRSKNQQVVSKGQDAAQRSTYWWVTRSEDQQVVSKGHDAARSTEVLQEWIDAQELQPEFLEGVGLDEASVKAAVMEICRLSTLTGPALWSVQYPSLRDLHAPMSLSAVLKDPESVAVLLAELKARLPLLDTPNFLEKFPYAILLDAEIVVSAVGGFAEDKGLSVDEAQAALKTLPRLALLKSSLHQFLCSKAYEVAKVEMPATRQLFGGMHGSAGFLCPCCQ